MDSQIPSSSALPNGAMHRGMHRVMRSPVNPPARFVTFPTSNVHGGLYPKQINHDIPPRHWSRQQEMFEFGIPSRDTPSEEMIGEDNIMTCAMSKGLAQTLLDKVSQQEVAINALLGQLQQANGPAGMSHQVCVGGSSRQPCTILEDEQQLDSRNVLHRRMPTAKRTRMEFATGCSRDISERSSAEDSKEESSGDKHDGVGIQFDLPSAEDGGSTKDMKTSLYKGKEFPTVKDLRNAVAHHAVQNCYEFAVVKSDIKRYTIKGKDDKCMWRLHGSHVSGGPIVVVKDIGEHTCGGLAKLSNRQATSTWVARMIEPKLRDTPDYKPVEIMNDLFRDHRVNVKYRCAWKGKEIAKASILGSDDDGYRYLRQYCEEVQRSNLGSRAFMQTEAANSRFQRMFLALDACIRGFQHCRPLIGLDGTFIKTRYRGCLMGATAIDAQGQLFPVAFALVAGEDADNWSWFLNHLKGTFESRGIDTFVLTFLSDREKGLIQAVQNVFYDSPHGFCMKHIADNVAKRNSGPLYLQLLWSAAKAPTFAEFSRIISRMHVMDKQTTTWLLKTCDPALWSDAFFVGHRYGHYTSNIAESLNGWIFAACQKPAMHMFEHMRRQLYVWYLQRRRFATGITTALVPGAEARLSAS
ncbi:hypothetical protein CBR_g8614 [Chara braunii]|uniref:MULE transposase domain-containing protein n=1 Tax=Chara braunii TaxID=69332 RepID=A0A388JS43_CHABU|nr:hypothetical protein CBR_g8614 [Chara braunii]|eukprot:GBG60593.1 hypothetical protein CBR_g8614 [Chara braunii]